MQQRHRRLTREDFDFARNDCYYQLTIPSYSRLDKTIFYELHLRDMCANKTFRHCMRYKQLKKIHQDLTLKYKANRYFEAVVPPFPPTHFLSNTNKHPKKIQERRQALEEYLNRVVTDPFLRSLVEIKKLISVIKSSQPNSTKHHSLDKLCPNKSRSRSLQTSMQTTHQTRESLLSTFKK